MSASKRHDPTPMNSSPSPRNQPNPVLAGLAVGVLLFAFTACTAGLWFLPSLTRALNLAPAPGQSWQPPATAEPTATSPANDIATPTPELENTPTPDLPTPSGPQTFTAGDRARNVNDGPVNLRRSPGYLNKPASDRIGLVPAGDDVEIIGGPRAADELIWWQVRWQGLEGWMAELRASGIRILAPIEAE